MYWIKRIIYIMLISLFFSGCGSVSYNVLESLNVEPNRFQDRILLEKVPNDEFLDFVLKRKLIDTNREDILYVDNLNYNQFDGLESNKIILSKNNIYIITLSDRNVYKYIYSIGKFDQNIFYKIDNKDFIVEKRKYTDAISKIKEFPSLYCTNRKYYKSCNRLIMFIEKYNSLGMTFTREYFAHHRFNDIHKIKQIIDERIVYHKKHKTYEKDNE